MMLSFTAFLFRPTLSMYQDSRDRTFLPPTLLDDALLPSAPPSEAGSSRSSPPNMILRYNDGRPDIRIHHPAADFALSSTRQQQHHHHHNGRPRSRHESGRGRSNGRPVLPADNEGPEQIHILPSKGASLRSSHARAKSLPRKSDYVRDSMADIQNYHHRHSPNNHKVTFAPPAQPTQPWHHSKYPNGKRPRYSSQQMYHQHQIGPNGVIYSHSAPPAGQYPPHFVAPSFHRGYPVVDSAETLGTEKTGSGTFYVLPSPGAHGQKLHIIAPSPEHSIITATSATKVTAPTNMKKPFFKRLFGKL